MELVDLLLKAKDFTPEIIVTFTALAVLTIDLFVPKSQKLLVSMLALFGLAVSFFALSYRFASETLYFNDMIIVDNFSVFFKVIFVLSAILTSLIAVNYLERFKIGAGEFYCLILFSTLGAMIMSGARDLVTIYIGLELLSISLYILVGLMAYDKKSNEAAMKYFLTGIFASAIMVYGISLLYGFSADTNLVVIAKLIKDIVMESGISRLNILPFIGMALLTVGFGFKISAAPFHMWTPDVYEGAPTPVTAFLSSVPKAAGMAVLLRLFLVAFISINSSWIDIFAILAVLTMTVGNIMAIRQESIKRMLAYSSIAHIGYVLTGITAVGVSSRVGIGSIAFYLLAYLFMNIGAFSILIFVNKKGRKGETFDELRGLSTYAPLVAAAMAIFMFSLAGIPPFAGFIAKYWVFSAVIKAGYLWLAVVAVLNSALSAYYYLRVVKAMYLDPVDKELTVVRSVSLSVAILIMALVTIILGIFPQLLMSLAEISLNSVF